MTYKEKIIEVLKSLGGHAYLSDIYAAFYILSADENIPKSYQAIIRATLERSSSDSSVFEGKEDLFYSIGGIGSGHWGLRNYTKTELTQEDDEFCEGKLFLKKHLYRERNPRLIIEAKRRFINQNGKLFCEICGFDFKDKYGELGNDFIEAHHIKPVSSMNDGDKTKIEDIIMVCSNCHSMIHRRKPWLGKEELKKILIK